MVSAMHIYCHTNCISHNGGDAHKDYNSLFSKCLWHWIIHCKDPAFDIKDQLRSVYLNYISNIKKNHSLCDRQTNQLMLLRGSVSFYCDNHMRHIKTLWGENTVSLKADSCCLSEKISWNSVDVKASMFTICT